MENWRQKSFGLFESFDTHNKKFLDEYNEYVDNIEKAEEEIKVRNDRINKINDEQKDLDIKIQICLNSKKFLKIHNHLKID